MVNYNKSYYIMSSPRISRPRSAPVRLQSQSLLIIVDHGAHLQDCKLVKSLGQLVQNHPLPENSKKTSKNIRLGLKI